jgi:hypothetical protein
MTCSCGYNDCDHGKPASAGNGGPAFPGGGIVGEGTTHFVGLSLRGYFAAKALVGLLASREVLMEAKSVAAENECQREAVIAAWAVEQADALLKAMGARQ